MKMLKAINYLKIVTEPAFIHLDMELESTLK